jgi:hypothetical protein
VQCHLFGWLAVHALCECSLLAGPILRYQRLLCKQLWLHFTSNPRHPRLQLRKLHPPLALRCT